MSRKYHNLTQIRSTDSILHGVEGIFSPLGVVVMMGMARVRNLVKGLCATALPGGGMFSSAQWKKPHCCSLGFPQVWNTRPLFGPSFCTVRVTAASLQLHITCLTFPAALDSCPLPPTDVFLNPRDGLGGWDVVGAGSSGPRFCGAPC